MRPIDRAKRRKTNGKPNRNLYIGYTDVINYVGGARQLLQDKTSLSISQVSQVLYDDDGDGFWCVVGVNFTVDYRAFENNLNLTAFIDIDGRCTGTGTLGGLAFSSASNLNIVYLPAFTFVGQSTFSFCKLGYLNVEGVTSSNSNTQIFREQRGPWIRLPNWDQTKVGSNSTSFFSAWMRYADSNTSLNPRVYVPLLRVDPTSIGGDIGIMFANELSGSIYYLHPDMATLAPTSIANSTAAGVTFRFVDDFEPPNKIEDLIVYNEGGNQAEVWFVPPYSKNGIDFYEVYLEGVGDSKDTIRDLFCYTEISYEGQAITLPNKFIGNIRVVACDIYWNRSEISEPFYFDYREYTDNTFIGFTSNTWNTASALAAKLGISETNIENFQVIQESLTNYWYISCRITADYTLAAGAFSTGALVRHWRDCQGKCAEIENTVFDNNTLMIEAFFPRRYNYSSGSCFRDAYLYKIEFLYSNSTILLNGIRYNNARYINMPSNQYGVYYTHDGYGVGGGYWGIKKPVSGTFTARYFGRTRHHLYADFSGVSTLVSLALHRTYIYYVDAPDMVTNTGTGLAVAYNQITDRRVRLDNLNQLKSGDFRRIAGSDSRIYIPRVVTYDVGTGYNTFRDIVAYGPAKVYVDGALSGTFDPYLASRGFTVVFVTDFTKPNEVTDAVLSNLTITEEGIEPNRLTKKHNVLANGGGAIDAYDQCHGTGQDLMIGDGEIEFEVEAANLGTNVFFGLTYKEEMSDWSELEYSILLTGTQSNQARAYEDRYIKYADVATTYTTGDKLSIERIGNTINYKKNGVTFYTSLKTCDRQWYRPAFFIYHTGATVYNAKLNGNLISWQNIVGCRKYTVDVNFTTPAAGVTPIDFYEVWQREFDKRVDANLKYGGKNSRGNWRTPVNWEWKEDIYSNSATISHLHEGKYQFQIKTCDEFWNRADNGNIVEITIPKGSN